jgi:hypothetical protein
MNRTVAAIVIGLIVSSGSWAFDFKNCVIASKIYCSKNKCKKNPNIWCLKPENQKKAQNYNEKLASKVKVKVKAKTKAVQAKEILGTDKANLLKGKSKAEKS